MGCIERETSNDPNSANLAPIRQWGEGNSWEEVINRIAILIFLFCFFDPMQWCRSSGIWRFDFDLFVFAVDPVLSHPKVKCQGNQWKETKGSSKPKKCGTVFYIKINKIKKRLLDSVLEGWIKEEGRLAKYHSFLRTLLFFCLATDVTFIYLASSPRKRTTMQCSCQSPS